MTDSIGVLEKCLGVFIRRKQTKGMLIIYHFCVIFFSHGSIFYFNIQIKFLFLRLRLREHRSHYMGFNSAMGI